MNPAPKAVAGLVGRGAVLSGLGFALSFGWLWFPALQDWWLPLFLWRGGGVGLFYAVLAAGFFGYALLGRLAPDPRLTRLPHIAHGLSLLLIFISLAPSLFAPLRPAGAWFFLPVIGMALAGIVQGLFWTGALLALPGRAALAAYGAAVLAAAPLGWLGSLAEGRARVILLFVMLAAAWLAANSLRQILNAPPPEAKRPRGRPPKTGAENGPEGEPGAAARRDSPALVLAACAALLGLLAVGQCLLGPGAAVGPPWAEGLAPFLGVATVLLLVQARESGGNFFEKLFGPGPAVGTSARAALFWVAAVWGGALIIGLPNRVGWLLGGFLGGMVSSLALAVLAAEGPLRSPAVSGRVWNRAALALGATLVLAVLGTAAGRSLSATGDWPPQAAAFSARRAVGAACLALAAIGLLSNRSGRPVVNQARPETEPAPPETDPPAPSFTDRELEILALLRQGRSNRRIADQLDIQEGTVRFHLRNIYKKTGVADREELALLGGDAPDGSGAAGNFQQAGE